MWRTEPRKQHPELRLRLRTAAAYLVAGPALEAVGVELVEVENADGTLDAEVMQLAGHFEEEQVALRTEGAKRRALLNVSLGPCKRVL